LSKIEIDHLLALLFLLIKVKITSFPELLVAAKIKLVSLLLEEETFILLSKIEVSLSGLLKAKIILLL